MNEEQLKTKLKDIFLETFQDLPKEKFSFDLKQADYPGWDSFAHMQLVSKIEQSFGITLSMEDTIGIESAKDALKVLRKKLAK